MENSGTHLQKLLVAADVQVCRQICLYLRHVSLYQTYLPTPIQRIAPLPIPDSPWDTVSIDFIVELPESNVKDTIMVVIDSVTKHSHFVSTTTTLTAIGTAQVYLHHIWKHHRLPKKVVLDRGPQFVAEFMKELYRLLRVKLAATTTYHPQGDG